MALDVATLAIKVETADLKKGGVALDGLTAKGARAETQMEGVGKAAKGAGIAAKGMGGGVRNLGQQLNQIAQVGGMTGNWMQAIAVQLPDILGGFGLFGLAAGVAAGALIPFISGLAGGEKANKKFTDTLDDLSGSVGDLQSALEMAQTSLFDIKVQFGENAKSARDMNMALLQLAQLKALSNLDASAAALNDQFSGLSAQVQLFQEATMKAGGALRDDYLAMAQTAARQVQAQFGLTIVQATDVANALKKINSGDMQQVADGAHDLAQTLLQAKDESGKIPEGLRQAAQGAAETAIEALKMAGYLKQAKDLEDAMAGANIAAPINSANEAAILLVGTLSTAIQQMNALNRAQAMGTLKSGGRGDGVAEWKRRLSDLNGGAREELAVPGSPMAKKIDAILNPKKKTGGAAAKAAKDRAKFFSSTDDEVTKLKRQIELIGKTTEEAARLEEKWRLLDEAKKRGVDLDSRIAGSSETVRQKIEEQAASVGTLAAKYEQAKKTADFWKQTKDDLKSGLIDSIVEGKNLSDVFDNLAKSIAKAALQAALFGEGPFASKGGGGGLLGGLFSGLFKSFDGGGYTGAGSRSGGMDGKGGYLAMVHPNETIIDHTRGKGGGSQTEVIDKVLTLTDDGKIAAMIRLRTTQGYAASVATSKRQFGTNAQTYDMRGTT